MDQIMNVVKFVQAHSQELLLALTSLVTFASIIVKLTPTQADDNLLSKIMPFIEKLALNKKA